MSSQKNPGTSLFGVFNISKVFLPILHVWKSLAQNGKSIDLRTFPELRKMDDAINMATPMVMQESATLNAGQLYLLMWKSRKSTTSPRKMRSMEFPNIPLIIRKKAI